MTRCRWETHPLCTLGWDPGSSPLCPGGHTRGCWESTLSGMQPQLMEEGPEQVRVTSQALPWLWALGGRSPGGPCVTRCMEGQYRELLGTVQHEWTGLGGHCWGIISDAVSAESVSGEHSPGNRSLSDFLLWFPSSNGCLLKRHTSLGVCSLLWLESSFKRRTQEIFHHFQKLFLVGSPPS